MSSWGKMRLKLLLKPLRKHLPKFLKIWLKKRKVRQGVYQYKKWISPEELEPQYRRALLLLASKQKPKDLGDYLEFGVCHGTSLICMNNALNDLGFNHVRLFGFDSFEGLPATAKTDDGGAWRPGQFQSEYEITQEILTQEGINWKRTFLIKGWFRETLNAKLIHQHKIQKASVVMVDCDMYLSAKEALDFCVPLIKDQTVIVFDDWNSFDLAARDMGEKRAFKEFLAENPQFEAEEIGGYSYRSSPNGKIFLVSHKQNSNS